jgi:predicted house-cleaning NTP pyrophosphatase (Maf/HAM1 superfamily)
VLTQHAAPRMHAAEQVLTAARCLNASSAPACRLLLLSIFVVPYHWRTAAGVVYEDVDINTIHFSAIPEQSIEALIEEGSVFHCAGGAFCSPFCCCCAIQDELYV